MSSCHDMHGKKYRGTYRRVRDKDFENDHEGDSTVNGEKDHEQSNDCSYSKIQGRQKKKAKMSSCQDMHGKKYRRTYRQVRDKDCEKDHEGDSTVDREENYEQSSDCSYSKIPGPQKTKVKWSWDQDLHYMKSRGTYRQYGDEDSNKDHKEDSAVDCEEDNKLSNDCSNSEIQGPKKKKARNDLCQDMPDKKWEEMYQSLVEYKTQHGNLLVPLKYNKNPQLAKWVRTQRNKYSAKVLPRNQILRLESIGFIWSVPVNRWNSMFQLLVEYRFKHGDTRVPPGYNNNPQFVQWVKTQRRRYRCRGLTTTRGLRLQLMGFNEYTNC